MTSHLDWAVGPFWAGLDFQQTREFLGVRHRTAASNPLPRLEHITNGLEVSLVNAIRNPRKDKAKEDPIRGRRLEKQAHLMVKSRTIREEIPAIAKNELRP